MGPDYSRGTYHYMSKAILKCRLVYIVVKAKCTMILVFSLFVLWGINIQV